MENNIRLGKISAVDYAAGTVRVVYHEKDDAVTAPIPLISTEAGVVLGRPWSEKNKPPEGSKGLYRKDLARSPGECMIRYKDGTLTIKAPKVVIDGTVTVSGDVTAGGVSLDNHTHTDSMGGGTSGPS